MRCGGDEAHSTATVASATPRARCGPPSVPQRARGRMAMKPVFLCTDSCAIPPHAPTGGFRHSLLTQRSFALTVSFHARSGTTINENRTLIHADSIRVHPRSSVAFFKSVFMPDWAQSAMKIGTQIHAETTDLRRFYQRQSSFSAPSASYFQVTTINENRTLIHTDKR